MNTPRALRTCDRREEKKTFNIISNSNKIDLIDLFSNDTKKGTKKKRSKTAENSPSPAKRKRGPYKKTKLKEESSSIIANETNDENSNSRKRTSSVSSISNNSMGQLNGKKSKYLDSSTTSNHSTEKLNKTVSYSKPVRKSDVNETIITKCCKCDEITVNNKKLTIKCGECNNSYHLKCIEESVKQYKGYAWLCKNCQSSSSSDNNDLDGDHNSDTEQESVNIEKQTSKSSKKSKKN
jgi:hypothetical protein